MSAIHTVVIAALLIQVLVHAARVCKRERSRREWRAGRSARWLVFIILSALRFCWSMLKPKKEKSAAHSYRGVTVLRIASYIRLHSRVKFHGTDLHQATSAHGGRKVTLWPRS